MGRPGKAVATIDNSISHRTKAEIEQREKAESALLSGVKITERRGIKSDPAAHREFKRVKKLLTSIGKADELYGAVCNRYCELYAEIIDCKGQKAKLEEMLDEIRAAFGRLEDEGDIRPENIDSYTKQVTQLVRQINNIDSMIMQKRKMRFDIEKENCMTVASSIRAIPKTVDKQSQNPIFEALFGDEEEEEPEQVKEQ